MDDNTLSFIVCIALAGACYALKSLFIKTQQLKLQQIATATTLDSVSMVENVSTSTTETTLDFMAQFIVHHPYICDVFLQNHSLFLITILYSVSRVNAMRTGGDFLISKLDRNAHLDVEDKEILKTFVNMVGDFLLFVFKGVNFKPGIIQISDKNSLNQQSTGVLLDNTGYFQFFLTEEQKKNSEFCLLFQKLQKKPYVLISIFSHPSTKYNIKNQIVEMKRYLGLKELKTSEFLSFEKKT